MKNTYLQMSIRCAEQHGHNNSDLFGSESSGSEGKSTPSTKITIWRQERCGAPVWRYKVIGCDREIPTLVATT